MVVPGTGAAQAGIRMRDVLVDAPDPETWRLGQVVPIRVKRDGRLMEFQVTLGPGEWRSEFMEGAL